MAERDQEKKISCFGGTTSKEYYSSIGSPEERSEKGKVRRYTKVAPKKTVLSKVDKFVRLIATGIGN